MLRELTVGESALLTDVALCINYYRLFSPGLYCCVHAPVQLDKDTRFHPGVLAMVNYGPHKQCDPGEKYDCFYGPPNFALDVFPGDDMLDYEKRRACYEKARVIEYVALKDTQPLEWIWNRLIDSSFVEISEDRPGMISSSSLPGLWIYTEDLIQRDWWRIMGSIARGVTREPHHKLMSSILRKED